MNNAKEVMDKVYELIENSEKYKNSDVLESFDNECFEVLKNENEETIKKNLEKLESLNIFSNGIEVLKLVPKTWSVIYSVLNEFYAINPRIVEYNEANRR